jgi:hypothetical protein
VLVELAKCERIRKRIKKHTRKINGQSVTVRRINGTAGQTEIIGRARKNEIRNIQNEVPVLLVHDAVSLGKHFPTFRDNVVVSSVGFEVPKNVGVYVDVGATATGDWIVADHRLTIPVFYTIVFVSQCR